MGMWHLAAASDPRMGDASLGGRHSFSDALLGSPGMHGESLDFRDCSVQAAQVIF